MLKNMLRVQDNNNSVSKTDMSININTFQNSSQPRLRKYNYKHLTCKENPDTIKDCLKNPSVSI